MSILRGDVYVWRGHRKLWYVWADNPNGKPKMCGWAQGRKHPHGIGLTEKQMDALCEAWAKRQRGEGGW